MMEALSEHKWGDNALDDIAALLLSAEKWRLVWAGKAADGGRYDCACCWLDDWRVKALGGSRPLTAYCSMCPIEKQTGEAGCRGTPYSVWSDRYWAWSEIKVGDLPEKKAAAEAMYCWLIDLALERIALYSTDVIIQPSIHHYAGHP